MLKGLNANGPFWAETADHLVALGVQACRPDMRAYTDPFIFRQNEAEARGRYALLPIVHTLDHLAMIPADSPITDVELMNEPNINAYSPDRFGGNMARAATAYADAIRPLMTECARRGFMPWIGCTDNLDDRSLRWLAAVLVHLPSDAIYGVSFHCYTTDPIARRAQLQQFKSLVGSRRIICTEFGVNVKRKERYGWFHLFTRVVLTSDAEALRLLRAFFVDFEGIGCEAAYVYQIVNSPIDPYFQYGIADHDANGWRWKPQAACFQAQCSAVR